MTKFVCSVCGYTAEGENPPSVCPVCGASASQFTAAADAHPVRSPEKNESKAAAVHAEGFTPLELSICFSSLANGCDKQHKPVERDLFHDLSEGFRRAADAPETASYDALNKAAEEDLNVCFPRAKAAASAAGDRGALRALVWSEKVTMIHNMLLSRYAAEGDAFLKGQNIYVCPVCGFIFVGEHPPEKCPVCSVPPWKFDVITEGA